MADILFNKQGIPLLASGKNFLGKTTGVPEPKSKLATTPKPAEINLDKTNVGNIKLASWGSANNWPDNADGIINKVGTLNTGLRFTRNFTLGQGIFPCTVTGFDTDGNEILTPPKDLALTALANSRMTRKYMEIVLRDYLKLGIGYVQFIFNLTGDKIVGINPVNAKYCRMTVANNSGVIEQCVVSGKWPDTPNEGEYTVHELLDEFDPFADLMRRKYANKIKGKSFMMAIRDSWSNNEYYPAPLWFASYLAGWVDIAGMIPSFLKKAYSNQITWKWHIQIPYAFWDRQFPANEFATTDLRKTAISDYMDSVESNLCGTDNADKPIFTFFEINPVNGKAEEQWKIEPLNNKLSNEQNLITSAAANSEIMFAIMVNPNVMGAGMPGGAYAGNSGGSNIREAYLVNVANAWLDRQTITDPIEIMHRYNGGDENIEWRFRNTILTTLDTGTGTKKILS